MYMKQYDANIYINLLAMGGLGVVPVDGGYVVDAGTNKLEPLYATEAEALAAMDEIAETVGVYRP